MGGRNRCRFDSEQEINLVPEARQKIVERISENLSKIESRTWILREIYKIKRPVEVLCEIEGISVRTYYRVLKDPIDHRTTRENYEPANKLSPEDVKLVREAIEELKYSNAYECAQSVVKYLHTKYHRYICSPSTIKRIIRTFFTEIKPYTPAFISRGKSPVGCATAPGQILVGDTTYLTTNVKGKYFYMYVLMDLFSRKIVGYDVKSSDNAQDWSNLLYQVCLKEGYDHKNVRLHLDNGSAYKAKTFEYALRELGITISHSRPLVSNDNCFAESVHRTLKRNKHLVIPIFDYDRIDIAQKFCKGVIDFYNNEHQHSSLAFFTPNEVYTGAYKKELDEMNAEKMKVYLEHPERFGKYTPLKVNNIVYLAPPKVNKRIAYEESKRENLKLIDTYLEKCKSTI